MKKLYLSAIFTLYALTNWAQMVSGIVVNEKSEPLTNVMVYWEGLSQGTSTNKNGSFSLESSKSTNRLVVSILSYYSDTVVVSDLSTPLRIELKEDPQWLQEAVVSERGASTFTSRTSPLQTQQITAAELCKAACCNLSESFETNASVDVAYSDGATGAKQIRMLGLAGTYVQMLSENTPGVRGIASNYGMEYVPGVWMESIQVSKGTASVINGYEAITGQINVEYLKPKTSSPLAINGMFNNGMRAEINATGGWELNDKVSTGILAHYRKETMQHDDNKDGFIDIPLGNQVNLLNRWDFSSGKWTGRLLVRGLYDERLGGQMRGHGAHHENPYRIDITAKRFDAFMKNGFVFNQEKGTSIGLITSGSYHDQTGVYGDRLYHGAQTNLYFNGIFQTYFGDDHKLVTGLSVNYDKYDEGIVLSAAMPDLSFDRTEITPGAFAEYAYTRGEKLSLLAGVRIDHSSRYGLFFTPRMNVRYSPWKWVALRGSAGMGYRSPNILTDYSNVLPSSRTLIFASDFKQERALNTGVSSMFYIPIGKREMQLSVEYYYTNFFESVVADMDSDPHAVTFSNLNGGKSYAGNFQVEANVEILKGWTLTAAYRITDSKQTINGVLREKALTNRYKGLLSTSYTTPLKKWQFDFTAQFNGGGRMPDPDMNNPMWESEFQPFTLLMGQVTKYFRTWSIYLGGENLTGFTQKNPIIDAENPFGTNFDASMAWGPMHGAKIYVGFRWALDKKEK